MPNRNQGHLGYQSYNYLDFHHYKIYNLKNTTIYWVFKQLFETQIILKINISMFETNFDIQALNEIIMFTYLISL